MHSNLESEDTVTTPHLSAHELAGYVDGLLPAHDRGHVERHLATCAECRAEYRAVRALVRPDSSWRRSVGVWLAAAAAIALVVWAGRTDVPGAHSVVREPAALAGSVPLPHGPVGSVAAVHQIAWAPVTNAINYRLVVFDTVGQAVAEAETPDTVQVLPDTVRLIPGVTYYWKVEAQTDWGRWTPSPLTRFRIAPPR